MKKKYLSMILIIGMLLCMSGCGPDTDDSSALQESQQAQSSAVQSEDEIFETERLQTLNLRLDGQISQVFDYDGLGYDWYVVTKDRHLFLAEEDGETEELDIKDVFGLRETFDTIVLGKDRFNTDCLMAIKDNRIYMSGIDGGTNFYFTPKEYILSFKFIEIGKILETLSFDPETNRFTLQRCYTDGKTIEYQVKLCDDTTVYGSYKVGVEADIEIKQVVTDAERGSSPYAIMIMDTDGNLYQISSWERVDDENMIVEWLIKPYQAKNGQFENIDTFFYATVLRNAVYSEQGSATELRYMIDFDKNEALSVPLPNGYTISDVKKVYYKEDSLIVLFDDHAVYVSLEDEIETLVYAEDLTKANANGALESMQCIFGRYIAVLEDGNVYRIEPNP